MKVCRVCNVKIVTKKERYVHLEDWKCEKMEADSWWHLNCFKKAMNRELTQLEKQAGMMLNKAGAIFKNLPEEFKPKEEYVIT